MLYESDCEDASDGEIRMSSFRVLHIDDAAEFRELVAAWLGRESGIAVRSCSSAAEGLVAAAEWRPHLILLDWRMPGTDGRSMLAHLRKNPKTANIPVVFITALVNESHLELFKALGAAGTIPKPLDPKTFATSVRGYLVDR
jgi:two-component system, OmpR family, response regulator